MAIHNICFIFIWIYLWYEPEKWKNKYGLSLIWTHYVMLAKWTYQSWSKITAWVLLVIRSFLLWLYLLCVPEILKKNLDCLWFDFNSLWYVGKLSWSKITAWVILQSASRCVIKCAQKWRRVQGSETGPERNKESLQLVINTTTLPRCKGSQLNKEENFFF